MREILLHNRAKEVVGRALVDDEDYERVAAISWSLSPDGYARGAVTPRPNHEVALMHRFILGLTDPAVKTDHRNRNRLDNRRENLRLGSDADNAQNRDPHGSPSGYRGVKWAARNNKWRVQVCLNGKRISLGLYTDVHEAGAVATAWRAANMPFSEEASRV